MVDRTFRNGSLDRAAMAVSGLCLVHCAATAILIGLLSSAGDLLGDPIIHRFGLVLATTLGAVALSMGWRAHHRLRPAIAGGLGLMLMVAGIAAPHGAWEIALTMSGVALLAFGHHLNRRARA